MVELNIIEIADIVQILEDRINELRNRIARLNDLGADYVTTWEAREKDIKRLHDKLAKNVNERIGEEVLNSDY